MRKPAASPFDPVKIGPISLRNRFTKSGAYKGMCRGGRPTKALLEHERHGRHQPAKPAPTTIQP